MAIISSPLFYAAEITYADKSSGVVSYLNVSDAGYRTRSSDAGMNFNTTSGVLDYAPLILEAFSISRAVNLAPSDNGISASWGTLKIANQDNVFGATVINNSTNSRAIKILYGKKVYEDPAQQFTLRNSSGTYVDADGAMYLANAGETRVSYESGTPVLLAEAGRTNSLTNSLSQTWTGNGDATITNNSTEVDSLYSSANVVKGVISGGTGSKVVSFISSQTIVSGTQYTCSVWIYIPSSTPAGLTNVQFQAEGNATGGAQINATVTNTNVWQRISTVFTATASTTTNLVLRVSNATNNGTVVYASCPQMEIGNGRTSYIPTSGSAQTRATETLYVGRGIWRDPPYAALKTLFQGVADEWQLVGDAVNVPLRDNSFKLERPFPAKTFDNSAGGSAYLYGGSDLVNKPRPILYGKCYNITPLPIAQSSTFYQYGAGPAFTNNGSVDAVYEGGYPGITFQSPDINPPTTWPGTTTNAGQYQTCTPWGQFKLGSAPVHPITIDTTGASTGNPDYCSNLVKVLLAIVDNTLSESASFAAAATNYPYLAGIWHGAEAITGIDLIGDLLESMAAKLITTRSGLLRLYVLRALSGTENPVITIDKSDVIDIQQKALPDTLAPVTWRWRVGYQRNFTVQSESDLNLASITADQKAFATQENRYSVSSDTTIKSHFANANDPDPIGGLLNSSADAQSVASDLLVLWGTPRYLYTVTIPVTHGVTAGLGDVVEISYPIGNLSGGKLGQIVAETFNSGDSTLTFDILI